VNSSKTARLQTISSGVKPLSADDGLSLLGINPPLRYGL
jgi:hypothetical protein